MELKVYDWEKFDRSNTWFIVFAFVILLVVILSILSSNIFWWVLVFLVAWGYIFYITKINDTTKMIVWKQALQIWKVVYPYDNLNGFVLEYHTKKKKIHNIVIIDNKKNYRIYTIKDTEKNLESFVNELNWYIPMLDSYEQTTMDKFIRKLKL
jgi:lipopolysaccharide export LptBFGC system permease protein LptF